MIELEVVPCPLCGSAEFTAGGRLRDLALGVPGEFHLASCDARGLLFQDPRVRADQLELVYPDHYGPHAREPELTRTLKKRGRAPRWVLATSPGTLMCAPTTSGWRTG